MTDVAPTPPFPASLSPSRAADFMTCPLLFRFRSIDRLPEEPSAAAVRGTLVHRALETLFDLPAAERTVGAASVLVRRAFDEMAQDEPEAADTMRTGPGSEPVLDVSGLLDAYFALEDPRRLEPHARELAVSAQLSESFEVRGFIDRVDRTADGRIRIVDYKTGRSPGAGYESKAMFQMRFYALAWWRMTGDVPRLLQLMYLGNGEVLRYEPEEDDLDGHRAEGARAARRHLARGRCARVRPVAVTPVRLVQPSRAVPRVGGHPSPAAGAGGLADLVTHRCAPEARRRT